MVDGGRDTLHFCSWCSALSYKDASPLKEVKADLKQKEALFIALLHIYLHLCLFIYLCV